MQSTAVSSDKALPSKSAKERTTVALVEHKGSCYMYDHTGHTLKCGYIRVRMVISVLLDSETNNCYLLICIGKELYVLPFDLNTLQIAVFMRSETEEITSHRRVRVNVINPIDGSPITITANMVPRIVDNVTSYNIKKYYQQYSQLRNFHNVQDGPEEEIGLLIGNNYMWSFILTETQITLAEHLAIPKIERPDCHKFTPSTRIVWTHFGHSIHWELLTKIWHALKKRRQQSNSLTQQFDLLNRRNGMRLDSQHDPSDQMYQQTTAWQKPYFKVYSANI